MVHDWRRPLLTQVSLFHASQPTHQPYPSPYCHSELSVVIFWCSWWRVSSAARCNECRRRAAKRPYSGCWSTARNGLITLLLMLLIRSTQADWPSVTSGCCVPHVQTHLDDARRRDSTRNIYFLKRLCTNIALSACTKPHTLHVCYDQALSDTFLEKTFVFNFCIVLYRVSYFCDFMCILCVFYMCAAIGVIINKWWW